MHYEFIMNISMICESEKFASVNIY